MPPGLTLGVRHCVTGPPRLPGGLGANLLSLKQMRTLETLSGRPS